MKQLMAISTVLFAALLFSSSDVQAQPGRARGHYKQNRVRTQFYYYPSANVYYNPVARSYWYPRNSVWVEANVLPAGFVITNQPSRVVYYDGYDVWRDNAVHCSYYRPQQVVVVRERPHYYYYRPRPRVDVHVRF